MRVKAFAEKMGVTPDTVRFYTREGLLTPSRDSSNGYRVYGERDRRRLGFIVAARSLGFTLEDIGHILGVADAGRTPCPRARELIQARLEDVEERFRQMHALRNRMLAAVENWETRPDSEPDGHAICHLIEGFDP